MAPLTQCQTVVFGELFDPRILQPLQVVDLQVLPIVDSSRPTILAAWVSRQEPRAELLPPGVVPSCGRSGPNLSSHVASTLTYDQAMTPHTSGGDKLVPVPAADILNK